MEWYLLFVAYILSNRKPHYLNILKSYVDCIMNTHSLRLDSNDNFLLRRLWDCFCQRVKTETAFKMTIATTAISAGKKLESLNPPAQNERWLQNSHPNSKKPLICSRSIQNACIHTLSISTSAGVLFKRPPLSLFSLLAPHIFVLTSDHDNIYKNPSVTHLWLRPLSKVLISASGILMFIHDHGRRWVWVCTYTSLQG